MVVVMMKVMVVDTMSTSGNNDRSIRSCPHDSVESTLDRFDLLTSGPQPAENIASDENRERTCGHWGGHWGGHGLGGISVHGQQPPLHTDITH